jgi:DNA-binding response OmpR family regulator
VSLCASCGLQLSGDAGLCPHHHSVYGDDWAVAQRLAVPVIFITAHDDAITRERIEKSGAAGHLQKPFDEQAVLDAIRRAVSPDDGMEEPRVVIGLGRGSIR